MTYIVTIHRTHTLLKLTYKKGVLCKIEIKRGGLNSQQYQQLGTILPPQEEDIRRYQENGMVVYHTLKTRNKVSIFTTYSWMSGLPSITNCSGLHQNSQAPTERLSSKSSPTLRIIQPMSRKPSLRGSTYCNTGNN